MQDNYFCRIICLKFLADCFRHVYTHHRIWWIHGSWWQLVISIHDKADGLILCEQCLKGCDHAHSWCVNFAGCGRMVTFKVSLWIFCCNLIDVLVIRLWGPQRKSILQVHTPDSSRYWIAASYEDRQSQGMEPENIDKVLCSALRCYWMLFSESQYFPYPLFFNCLR